MKLYSKFVIVLYTGKTRVVSNLHLGHHHDHYHGHQGNHKGHKDDKEDEHHKGYKVKGQKEGYYDSGHHDNDEKHGHHESHYLYYYHPDHLGSTQYVTDAHGHIYEHVEYFPFGETWIEEKHGKGIEPKYLFTSKELDQETGLYYHGARYYDPRTSVWQSADPILDSYLNGKPNGGVMNPPNLNLFAYTYQNPVKYFDPSGQVPRGPDPPAKYNFNSRVEAVREALGIAREKTTARKAGNQVEYGGAIFSYIDRSGKRKYGYTKATTIEKYDEVNLGRHIEFARKKKRLEGIYHSHVQKFIDKKNNRGASKHETERYSKGRDGKGGDIEALRGLTKSARDMPASNASDVTSYLITGEGKYRQLRWKGPLKKGSKLMTNDKTRLGEELKD
ncbi:MAG: hypothetical protein IEMM0008_0371 [bacterium]|nr:MAG: hypothetical protein IEMM0008_0371 [bacterium]